jgi:hypothetical protein
MHMSMQADDASLASLNERQQVILASLPKFVRITLLASLGGFLLTQIVKLVADQSARDRLTAIHLADITLGSLVAFLLSLVSDLVVWVFVIWSIAFVPYIAYRAHTAARQSIVKSITRPMRWIQLYASTFLPMTIFALAWNSIETRPHPQAPLRFTSALDVILFVFGAAGSLAGLFLINWKKCIPPHLVAIRLSLLSCLLYVSLFLSYGWGISLASEAMVFGILIYLVINTSGIAELGRRLSIYDVDPAIADQLEKIAIRHDALNIRGSKNFLKQKEQEVHLAEQQVEIGIEKSDSEMTLVHQRMAIRKKGLDLNRKMNETQLKVLERKIEFLAAAVETLSSEISERMGKEIPALTQELRENVKTYTPQQLQERMNSIVSLLDSRLLGNPVLIAEIREQLLATTSELDKHTILMASELSNDNSEPPPAPNSDDDASS